MQDIKQNTVKEKENVQKVGGKKARKGQADIEFALSWYPVQYSQLFLDLWQRTFRNLQR